MQVTRAEWAVEVEEEENRNATPTPLATARRQPNRHSPTHLSLASREDEANMTSRVRSVAVTGLTRAPLLSFIFGAC